MDSSCRIAAVVVALSLPGLSALAAEPVDYLRNIKPIFKERCFACHAALKQEAGLRLDTGTSIRKGSENGPVLVIGKSAGQCLIERSVVQRYFRSHARRKERR